MGNTLIGCESCHKHGRYYRSGDYCVDCVGDAYAEAYAKDSPKESDPESMSKSSVEALVKVMLGPIEDRLREMELAEKDRRLKAIEAQVKFYPGSVTLEKDELARLRRIEKAVQNVVSSWNTGRSLDSVYVELSGAIRS